MDVFGFKEPVTAMFACRIISSCSGYGSCLKFITAELVKHQDNCTSWRSWTFWSHTVREETSTLFPSHPPDRRGLLMDFILFSTGDRREGGGVRRGEEGWGVGLRSTVCLSVAGFSDGVGWLTLINCKQSRKGKYTWETLWLKKNSLQTDLG